MPNVGDSRKRPSTVQRLDAGWKLIGRTGSVHEISHGGQQDCQRHFQTASCHVSGCAYLAPSKRPKTNDFPEPLDLQCFTEWGNDCCLCRASAPAAVSASAIRQRLLGCNLNVVLLVQSQMHAYVDPMTAVGIKLLVVGDIWASDWILLGLGQ